MFFFHRFAILLESILYEYTVMQWIKKFGLKKIKIQVHYLLINIIDYYQLSSSKIIFDLNFVL